jgi:hypothetical protein
VELLASILDPIVARHPSPLLLPQRLDSDHLLLLNPTLSPRGILSPATPSFDSALVPSHKDFILVAQIVAEQIIYGSTGRSYTTFSQCKYSFYADVPEADLATAFTGLALNHDTPAPVHAAQAAIQSLLHGSISCDLLKYVCVQDNVLDKNQMAKMQQQPPRKGSLPNAQSLDGTYLPGAYHQNFYRDSSLSHSNSQPVSLDSTPSRSRTSQ